MCQHRPPSSLPSNCLRCRSIPYWLRMSGSMTRRIPPIIYRYSTPCPAFQHLCLFKGKEPSTKTERHSSQVRQPRTLTLATLAILKLNTTLNNCTYSVATSYSTCYLRRSETYHSTSSTRTRKGEYCALERRHSCTGYTQHLTRHLLWELLQSSLRL